MKLNFNKGTTGSEAREGGEDKHQKLFHGAAPRCNLQGAGVLRRAVTQPAMPGRVEFAAGRDVRRGDVQFANSS